jgi:hypothetical protein
MITIEMANIRSQTNGESERGLSISIREEMQKLPRSPRNKHIIRPYK